jgi:hypothetical protein
VHGLLTAYRVQIIFRAARNKTMWSLASGAASYRASLARASTLTRIDTARYARARLIQDKVVDAVRFSETINGRPYIIEVSPVGRDRWRAQLARTPNGTTALMPFYGQTPDEAARRLAVWLARAVRVAT